MSSLRDDVAGEMAASARLVDLMLSIGEAREHGGERIERLLANGELRHLRVDIERADLEQASPSGAVHGPLVTLAQRLSDVEEEALGARSVALADRSVIRIGGGDPKDMFNGKYNDPDKSEFVVEVKDTPVDVPTIELNTDNLPEDKQPELPAAGVESTDPNAAPK